MPSDVALSSRSLRDCAQPSAEHVKHLFYLEKMVGYIKGTAALEVQKGSSFLHCRAACDEYEQTVIANLRHLKK